MPTVYDVVCWQDVASFVVWLFVVCAVAKAVFASFPASEIQYRLTLRRRGDKLKVGRLNWELRHSKTFPVTRDTPSRELTEQEIATKAAELKAEMEGSFWWRARNYLMNCWACQTFWAAVFVYMVTKGTWFFGEMVFTGMAYSGAAVLIVGILPVASTTKGGCVGGNCGGRK